MAQFGSDSFCYQASSPWQEQGAFFANYRRGLSVDPHTHEALDPDVLVVQLPSHELYRDWELTADGNLPAWPGGPPLPTRTAAIIDEDCYDAYRRADPDGFAVEYLAQWRASISGYLRIEDVDALFAPWNGAALTMRARGTLQHSYIAHADPSRSGANFAVIVAHAETDPQEQRHVIVDYWHAWQPSDFAGGVIDYEIIFDELKSLMDRFAITRFTMDQFNSAGLLDRLNAYAATNPHRFTKATIQVRPATAQYNLRTAETLKTALTLKFVHAPWHPLAHAELRALELRNGKVDHPTRGPVTTSDLVDCQMAVVYSLLGDGCGYSIQQAFGATVVRGSQSRHEAIREALGNVHKRKEPQRSAARGGRFQAGWRR